VQFQRSKRRRAVHFTTAFDARSDPQPCEVPPSLCIEQNLIVREVLAGRCFKDPIDGLPDISNNPG
jgi:hypothetical protein